MRPMIALSLLAGFAFAGKTGKPAGHEPTEKDKAALAILARKICGDDVSRIVLKPSFACVVQKSVAHETIRSNDCLAMSPEGYPVGAPCPALLDTLPFAAAYAARSRVEGAPGSADCTADRPCSGGTGIISSTAERKAVLVDGKCSICIEDHEKSTVTMESTGWTTSMYCGPGHYDEDGKYVAPPTCNTTTSYGKCSRGHIVMESGKQ